MESHTLEILQQGVWASLTGGWFYDLRQNVFCNTFHLYLWLFLLCFPFILYLYFLPGIAAYSFYCGTITFLFTLLKVVNHKLHQMFDTTECVEEVPPGEDLPESQRRRSQTINCKTILEDEGIELQVFNGRKPEGVLCNESFTEPTDFDSIISLEVGAKAMSSTIDLKVDVHRKNSSESSEGPSLILASERVASDTPNGGDTIHSLKESDAKTPDTSVCNYKQKHKLKNNKLWLQKDEKISGTEGNEFILSQSDCHIAIIRKEDLEELSGEYKMSQSDCHISDLVHNSSELIHARMDSQYRQTLISNEKNKSFDMSNLSCCRNFTFTQGVSKDALRNTGSLELPLKEIGNFDKSVEKGLLYWKQQNLDKTMEGKSNVTQSTSPHLNSNLKITFDKSTLPSSALYVNSAVSNGSSLDDCEMQEGACSKDYNSCEPDEWKENSFIKILEENFDWCDSGYNRENAEFLKKKKVKRKHNIKHKSDEDIKCGNPKYEKSGSGLKFQVDSDEDLSDNNGSRSPLLCRHESLEKDNRFPAIDGCDGRIPLAYSGEEGRFHLYCKINRTSSVDDNVGCSNRNYKNNKALTTSDKNYFSSFLLSVYNCETVSDSSEKAEEDENEKVSTLSSGSIAHLHPTFSSRESFLHKNKLVLPSPGEGALSACEHKKRNHSAVEKKEVTISDTKKEGIDRTVKNFDSLTKNSRDTKKEISEISVLHKTELCQGPINNDVKPTQSQGAIPKTKIMRSHDECHSQTINSLGASIDICESCENCQDGKSSSFDENATENKILDEKKLIRNPKNGGSYYKSEDNRRRTRTETCWKKTYDTSNCSVSELSSLLPLSSLLSSLHPPPSPLLAAFLATRKEFPGSATALECGFLEKDVATKGEGIRPNVTFVRNRRKNTRSNRSQRASRSSRVSSFPLAALASVVSANSATHIATSHNDTSQGAIHCFQDERGNWISYTFDSHNGALINFTVSPSKCNTSIPEEKPGQLRDGLTNGKAGETRSGRKSGSLKSLESHSQSEYARAMNGGIGVPIEDLVRRRSRHSELTESDLCRRRNLRYDEKRVADSRICEPYSSNTDLLSNPNVENDGNPGINSVVMSPNRDVGGTRTTFASFVRERFLINQRILSTMTNNCSNSLDRPFAPNTILFNINENNGVNISGGNDNGNNNNNNNNSSSSSSSNNNGSSISTNNNSNNNNSCGRNSINGQNSNNSDRNNNVSGNNQSVSNFYSDGIVTGSVAMRSPFGLFTETFLERNRQRSAAFHCPATVRNSAELSVDVDQPGHDSEIERNHFRLFDFDDLETNTEIKSKSRHYYKLYYTPWNYVKIRFDRLELMALLDRNFTIFEVVLSLFLSVAVSLCGFILLNYGFYHDLLAFLFCFALAGCQYSLVKSVQPDATSPTHGYNRVVIYSRSIYFCVTSLLILLLTAYLEREANFSIQLYNIHLTDTSVIRTIRDSLVNLLLFFPVLFTLGLFPQINTFALYLMEQVDIHVFGGNAMSSLAGAAYCVARSIATSVFMYGFAYGALIEAKASQHLLFSIFSALLISSSYHLSRSSSNPTILWDILKNHILQDEVPGECRSKPSREGFIKKAETSIDKSTDESAKSEAMFKSEEANSQNNLLLSSNPSSNEMLKPPDDQYKMNVSEAFEYSPGDDPRERKDKSKEDFIDPLPRKLKQTVNARLKNDVIVCSCIALLVFGIHSSTIFTTLQPDLNPILWGIAGCSGIVLHYIVPEMRKHLPWKCLAGPVLKSNEHSQFEVRSAARVMWYEETYVILCFLERNLLYPVLVLAAITYDGPRICSKWGVPLGSLVTCICGLKVMRSAFSNTSHQYLIVIFSALLFEFDYYACSETFLVDYFFMGIVFSKTYEFLLKIQFVVIYIAPWQITWGSAFHAFAQPFSVPHSAMLFIQAAVSSLLSAPLNPFLGSAIFLASYVRPVKFWERDYNTKRVDHSNTRLSSHLERNLGSDDNNLNSIFYEHLTRSLQHSLCGDLELGRWGPVYQGDCFVLASDYLNCLVHIIEMGNGLVTFQMRGLEFRGTYCQQREVEAISECNEDDDGCCCCEPCHIPHILSVNRAFSKRWLAWEVSATKYILEGYSISDNSAASTLQVFDFRKVLVTYYVKSIIFYCIRSSKLENWLTNTTIITALEPLLDKSFVDLDPVFNISIDQDFDVRAEGITRNSFCTVYLEWIQYCCTKRDKPLDKSYEPTLVSLCLALSLMARRTLGTASHNTVSSVEFFLYGLHALFKGDFRITSIRDDWIFTDMEFLMKVVAPGVRMSLKLHQDHFMSPEEYEDPGALFDAISSHEENLVISHEGDPAWRSAVLSGTPSLLALRHVLDDGSDEYKIIMLNKRFLGFRVIKLNRECVRGLWAGQQQELVFLRNRNPERGSIQNAKQVLRNMINSSCDQPIGYPIYVSPLTTSYSDTNNQLTRILGGPLSIQGLKNSALKIWKRIRERCREGCSSGSAGNVDEGGYSVGHEGVYAMTNVNLQSGYGHNTSGSQSMDSSQMQWGSSNRGGSLGRSSVGGRGSLPSVGKLSTTTFASLAGLLSSAELPKGESFLRERETSFTFMKERQNREEKDRDIRQKSDERDRKREEKDTRKEKEKYFTQIPLDLGDESKEKETAFQRVRILHPNLVFDAINLGRRIDVLWPDEGMRLRGGRSHWKDWLPDAGMEGQVVHRWVPNHRDPAKRSHVDKTILLVKVEDKFVPIAEAGVQDLGVEV